MRAVNLISKDTNRGRPHAFRPLLLVAALAPILAIGIVAGGYRYEHSKVAKSQDELASIRAQVAAAQPVTRATTLPQLAALVTATDARRASLDGALANRFALYPTLVALARILPSDVWLTSLNLASPTPADAPLPPPAATTTTTTTTTTTAQPVAPPGEPERVDDRRFHLLAAIGRQAPDAARPSADALERGSDVVDRYRRCGPRCRERHRHYRAAAAKKAKAKSLVQFAISASVNPSTVGAGDMNIRGSQKTFAIALGAAAGLILVAGILLVVLPQRSHVSRLGNDTVAAEAQLSAARAGRRRTEDAQARGSRDGPVQAGRGDAQHRPDAVDPGPALLAGRRQAR